MGLLLRFSGVLLGACALGAHFAYQQEDEPFNLRGLADSGLVSRKLEPCKPGTRGFGFDNCLPCPDGEIAPEAGLRNCIPCPKGQTNNADFTACVPVSEAGSRKAPCPAGKFGFDGTACLPCADDSVSTSPGQRSCTKCGPTEKPNDSKTACIPKDEAPKVRPCPAGQFGNGGISCWPCFFGTIAPKEGQFTCDICPEDQESNSERTACVPKSDPTPVNPNGCQPGSFLDQGECSSCPVGMISTTVDQEKCTSCPGSEMPNESQTGCIPQSKDKPTRPIDKLPCPAGLFGTGDDDCTPCPPGEISSEPGQLKCTKCDDSEVPNLIRSLCVPSNGASTSSPPPTTTTTENPAATTTETTATPDANGIVPCPPGTFGGGNGSCWQCFFGTVSPGGQQTCDECNPETEESNSERTACIPKSQPTTTENTATTTMTSPITTTSDGTTTTSTEVSVTTTEEITTTAAPTTTSEEVTTTASSTTAEPVSTTTTTTSSTTDSPVTATIEPLERLGNGRVRCPAGAFSPDRVSCIKCPKGFVAPVSGRRRCKVCALGLVSNEGNTRCMKDPNLSPCPAGFAGKGGANCKRCQLNEITANPGRRKCKPCAEGRVSNPARTRCVKPRAKPCEPGFYGKGDNCKKCEVNTITKFPGRKKCKPCSDGRVSNEARTKCVKPKKG